MLNATVAWTRSTSPPTPREARTPARMMQVAASGPTISWRDGPSRAYPTRANIVANRPTSVGSPAIAG